MCLRKIQKSAPVECVRNLLGNRLLPFLIFRIIIYAAFCVCQAQPRHYKKSSANPGINDPVLCMDEIGDYKGLKHKFQVLNISNDKTRCQINMKTGKQRRIRLVDGSQPMSNESDAGESEPTTPRFGTLSVVMANT